MCVCLLSFFLFVWNLFFYKPIFHGVTKITSQMIPMCFTFEADKHVFTDICCVKMVTYILNVVNLVFSYMYTCCILCGDNM